VTALTTTIPDASRRSIECRLYAEDPNAGFLPQSGVLTAFETPAADWLRVDAGVASGSEVSIHYDPMIAKVVVHGADRAEAVARMRWALSRTVVTGIVSNRDHLLEVLGHPAFRAGELSTHFLEEHLAEPTPLPERVLQTAAASASLDAQARRPKRLGVSGYRNNRFQDQIDRYRLGDREIVVTYRDLGGERFRVTIDGGEAREVQRLEAPGPCRFEIGGHRFGVRVIPMGDRVAAIVGPHTVHLEVVPRFPDRSAASAIDGCAAPMPGQILEVQVAVGDRVEGGQSLMTMEAMKMEHRILAPHDGVVTRLDVKAGDQVSEGQLLAVVGD
jgi:acetyl/propionyl-CoA carboxylase alpha subunit